MPWWDLDVLNVKIVGVVVHTQCINPTSVVYRSYLKSEAAYLVSNHYNISSMIR